MVYQVGIDQQLIFPAFAKLLLHVLGCLPCDLGVLGWVKWYWGPSDLANPQTYLHSLQETWPPHLLECCFSLGIGWWFQGCQAPVVQTAPRLAECFGDVLVHVVCIFTPCLRSHFPSAWGPCRQPAGKLFLPRSQDALQRKICTCHLNLPLFLLWLRGEAVYLRCRTGAAVNSSLLW